MKLISSLLMAALVAAAGNARAADPSTNSTTKGVSMTDTDRGEIQEVLDRYEKALNDSDVDAVLEL
ncbi:MAG: hypothetical protein WBI00_07300, partial [Thermoanaerobaculia bacterium]